MLRFRNGRLDVFSLYLHRFLRLTPLLGASIVMTMTLARFTGSGPFWPFTMDHLSGHCERYWWSTFLYIQNYVNPTELVKLHKMRCKTRLFFNIFCLSLFSSAFLIRGTCQLTCNYSFSPRSLFIQFIDTK